MDIRYPATLEVQADGSFFVQFIDLPDTFTEGQTQEEALLHAGEVLSAMLAWRLDQTQTVPAPSKRIRGAYYIAPDAKTQAALLLRQLRLARGAKRHYDPLRWPSLKTLDRAATVLGKRLVLSLE